MVGAVGVKMVMNQIVRKQEIMKPHQMNNHTDKENNKENYNHSFISQISRYLFLVIIILVAYHVMGTLRSDVILKII